MATKYDVQLETLKKKMEQVKESKAKAARLARKAAADADRKQDLRRKLLLGAMVQAEMDKSPEVREQMLGRLRAYLTRDHDRELFGLADSPAVDIPADAQPVDVPPADAA